MDYTGKGIVGASLGAKENSPVSPPKENEIAREFDRLNENVEQLLMVITSVEERISPVLSPTSPRNSVCEEPSFGTFTAIGNLLHEQNNKLSIAISTLKELKSRVQI